MKIKFKQIDEQHIKIIGIQDEIEKEIGCIFTPSSSGQNILNAIQICSVEEVFDYWGCSRYIKGEGTKKRILNALGNEKDNYKQMKDIQVLFSFDAEHSDWRKRNIEFSKDCDACFNYPCTCENKGNHKEINPFNIKREWQLQDKIEYTPDHIPLKEQEKLLSDINDKKI